MAITLQDINNYFASNPNATPQQVANAIQSVGGLTPTISSALADRYGTTPNVVAQQYGALTQPSAPVQAPVQQSLQATNPSLYNAVMSNLQGIADESFGGKIQPYQTQIVSPIDPSKINAPKQLEREPAVYQTIQTEEGPAKRLVSGGGFKNAMNLGPDPQTGDPLGYVSTTPTYINQIPIVAKYDNYGKLTGYTQQKGIGGELLVTKTGGKGYVSGNWDASGNPAPIQGAWGSGGGFLGGGVGNVLGALALGYFGGGALADALGGGEALGLGDLSATDTSLGLAGEANAAANLNQVPNLGNLPKFGPAIQVADISNTLPNLTPPSTTPLGQLGSGTYVPQGDLGTEFVTQGGLNPPPTVGQITSGGVTSGAIPAFASAATGAMGSSLGGAATDALGNIIPAAGGAAAGTALSAINSGAVPSGLVNDGTLGSVVPTVGGGSNLLTPTNVLGASALGNVASGLNTSKAIQNAMNTQQGAYTQSVGTLGDIANYIRGIQAPYQQAGVEALNLLGQNKDYLTHQFNAQDLARGLAPNYDFMLQQGQMANQRAANLAGGALGGNALQGLNQFTQNYAGNAYQNAFQNYQAQRQNIYNTLAGIAGLGQTSTGQLTGAAGTYGTNLTNLNVGNAAAQAAGQIAQAGNVGSTISNIGNTALLASLLNQKGTVTPTVTT